MKIKLSFSFSLIIFLAVVSNYANGFMFWNQACSFPGVPTGYVSFPNSASLNITSNFSIETWVHPTNVNSPMLQMIAEKRTGTNSNGYALFLSSGRTGIATNGTSRLVGNMAIPNGRWTHIAGVYNASSNVFSVYVNGVLDSTVTITGASPFPADSLRIGKGNVISPFTGMMDEFRIWSRVLTGVEVSQFFRTSLGSATGVYSQLALSLTFQDRNSTGTDFTLFDWTDANGIGKNHGITAIDLGDRPSTTIAPNESIELDGINDFLTGPDNPGVSPTSAITMEAWINPRSVSGLRVIMLKGIAGGAGVNYSMRLSGGVLGAVINGNPTFNSTTPVPLNVWTHVAFTYNSTSGRYMFYVNGLRVFDAVNPIGTINNGTDNIFIGSGGTSGTAFDGFIDEVRISNYVKTNLEINDYLFQSIDEANRPHSNLSNVVYNLDGYAFDNAGAGPKLTFVSGAHFTHSGAIDNQPVSPINREDTLNFSQGFSLDRVYKRIPETGSVGSIVDSFQVNLDTTISDINVFVALNHSAEQELDICLISPGGDSVQIYDNQSLISTADNIVTIFDDQADSSVINNQRYVSYAPVIKPRFSLGNVLNGKTTAGVWRLRVTDVSGAGIGVLYSWGMQINFALVRPPSVGLRVFMQGFYRPVDSCIVDTIKVRLRSSISPFNEVGIYRETPDDNFVFYSTFETASYDSTYYLEVLHRNSIETWSANPVPYDVLSGFINYDFTLDPDSAFGSNEIEVDTLPRFAMYGGDIDTNDFIDVSDVTAVYNDANAFVVGYVSTDVTGDDFVDVTDLIITFNNSNNFIETMRP